MKKLFIIVSLLLLIFPAGVLAAAGVIQGTIVDVGEDRLNSNPIRTITFLITATAGGVIPDTVLTARNFEKVKGWCFRRIEAYPTGGTAPTAADVCVLDANGMDLLGSVDGGTTPYAGADLIHATLKRTVFGSLYQAFNGLHVNYYTPVKDLLTLTVSNSSANAEITIVLIFSR
jgi:hypothetical protein